MRERLIAGFWIVLLVVLAFFAATPTPNSLTQAIANLTLQNWNDLVELAAKATTVAAAIIGGLWALWRFVLEREGHAKIEFDLDLRVLGTQAGRILVEVIAIVENKGRVRHWLTDFRFDLLYLDKLNAVRRGDGRINEQVLFETVIKNRYWIPPDWMATFIDAGVKQRYTYVIDVPAETTFLIVFAVFKYPDAQSGFHTAQKAFPIAQKSATNAVREES